MKKFDSVVVFVDALPYEERHRMTSVSESLNWCRPIQPGFGYSINVKSELFAGLRPDDAGFLNEWGYSPGAGYGWAKFFRPIEKLLTANRFIKRGTSKVLSRVVGESLRNIPLPLLDSVFRTGVTAYERAYENPTVFSENHVDSYLYSEHAGDQGAFDALCADLQANAEPASMFLAMAGLDHVMHRDGKYTPAYDDEVHETDLKLRKIWELLQSRANNGRLLVISDHGMAQVEKEIPFEIEKHVAGVGRRYGYFVDATMVRIWVSDPTVRSEIDQWLAEGNAAFQILGDVARRQWGISSAEFGDIIVLLDEGSMFVPNFFSDFGCKAMHGYLPNLTSQQGLIASSEPLDSISGDLPLVAVEAFSHLQKFYRNATAV